MPRHKGSGVSEMGLSLVRSDQPARLYPEVVRVSLWAVFGLWLAGRLARLVLLIVRAPSAVIVNRPEFDAASF